LEAVATAASEVGYVDAHLMLIANIEQMPSDVMDARILVFPLSSLERRSVS
jgi:hypothetical protein